MVDDIQLTEHFSLFELTHTDHATLQSANRDFGYEHRDKLQALASAVLEPIRAIAGPVRVHCAARCQALNEAVGGVANSQHLLCEAADISGGGCVQPQDYEDFFANCKRALQTMNFGQLIFEDKGGKLWVHASLGTPYRAASRCRQILRMKEGKYTVEGGY
jgi:zinc D-Ala-D-Ala carboxypeptidase